MKPNRQLVYDKYNGHCAYCGCEIAIKDMQVDHLIAQHHIERFSLDQIHCEANYMPSCRSCNNFKKTFHLELFRSEINKQIKRQRDRPTFRLAERYGLIKCTHIPVVFYFETFNK